MYGVNVALLSSPQWQKSSMKPLIKPWLGLQLRISDYARVTIVSHVLECVQ